MGLATTAAVAASLTRPDGVLVAVVIYAAELLPYWRAPLGVFQSRWRWTPIVVYACALLLLTTFRLAYYGSPVPNTFYAKVGGIPLQRGLDYASNFLRDGAGFLLLPIPFAVVRDKRVIPGLCYALILTIYTIYVGGDVFKNGRFLLPCLPFLAATAAIGVDAAFGHRNELGLVTLAALFAAILWPLYGAESGPAMAAAGVVLASIAAGVRARFAWAPLAGAGVAVLVLTLASLLPAVDDSGARFPSSTRREKSRLSNFLSDDFVAMQARIVLQANPPVRLVAHPAIGRFGYYSMVPILDILGLADAHIARNTPSRNREGRRRRRPGEVIVPGHQRSDPEYVFSRKPDFIFIPEWTPKRRGAALPAVLDLWDDPRLDTEYVYNLRAGAYQRRVRGE